MKPYFFFKRKRANLWIKNSSVGEVTFNKGKQKSGAIDFFIRNHARGPVFKIPRG